MLRLPPIEFRQPRRLDEAVAALAGEQVRVVAGGTDLWPNMKRRHQHASTVVSLMALPELQGVSSNGELRLGATTTLSEIVRNDAVRERYPALARAAASISSPPLRNMGTLGGNLFVDTRCTYYNQTEEWRRSIDYCLKEQGSICWVATSSKTCLAHSASDTAPILCALGARVKLVSSAGERIIPLAELYRNDGIDYMSKQADEILTEVFVPGDADQEHCRSAFWKLRRRGSIDFSVLSVAAAVWMNRKGIVTRASMFLGAVASSPMPVDQIETLLVGNPLQDDLIAEVAHQAHKVATPVDNTDFAPSWRGKMATEYAEAALREIAGLAVETPAPRHSLTVV